MRFFDTLTTVAITVLWASALALCGLYILDGGETPDTRPRAALAMFLFGLSVVVIKAGGEVLKPDDEPEPYLSGEDLRALPDKPKRAAYRKDFDGRLGIGWQDDDTY